MGVDATSGVGSWRGSLTGGDLLRRGLELAAQAMGLALHQVCDEVRDGAHRHAAFQLFGHDEEKLGLTDPQRIPPKQRGLLVSADAGDSRKREARRGGWPQADRIVGPKHNAFAE